jgi:hypothetical protein
MVLRPEIVCKSGQTEFVCKARTTTTPETSLVVPSGPYHARTAYTKPTCYSNLGITYVIHTWLSSRAHLVLEYKCQVLHNSIRNPNAKVEWRHTDRQTKTNEVRGSKVPCVNGMVTKKGAIILVALRALFLLLN